MVGVFELFAAGCRSPGRSFSGRDELFALKSDGAGITYTYIYIYIFFFIFIFIGVYMYVYIYIYLYIYIFRYRYAAVNFSDWVFTAVCCWQWYLCFW